VTLIRADAVHLPLADQSVDLIVTSPPYFALRSYTDGGAHYGGQIGSEATPADFLAALWAVTTECRRVLKPTGSMFVNLGDKYAGSGGHNNSGVSGGPSQLQGAPQRRVPVTKATRRSAPDRYNQDRGGVPVKSLMGMPWRYALGCIDDLGLTLRAEIVWSKPNGLPESVKDRVRRSHEQWFHFTRSPRYYTALDEIREPQSEPGRSTGRVEVRGTDRAVKGGANNGFGLVGQKPRAYNGLGKLPGSVWSIPSEPLKVPAWLGVDHFAAFPQEWPRKLILGWSPSGICLECGEGRRPVVEKRYLSVGDTFSGGTAVEGRHQSGTRMGDGVNVTISGTACACPTPSAPTRPAVVLDPFGGTGTVAMVARVLGRYPVHVDLSADYLRLARWRIFDSGHGSKSALRTARERQGGLQ
jgi:DNA modification methylase